MSRIYYLFDYFKYLKNPISCLLFKFGYKKECTVKFRSHKRTVKLTKNVLINKIMDMLVSPSEDFDFIPFIEDVESEKEIITVLDNIKIYNPSIYSLNYIFSEYYTDYYSNFKIDYKNRVIIDVGANSGDTALYFASKGAKVYAFEPVKEYFDMALKNLDLNPELNKNIKIFNYGVSYKKGKLNIDAMDSVSSYISQNDSYEVEIMSLNDILKHVKPDLLKMDCEGCEFEIIENSDLSMFNELIFEYHSKIVGKDYMRIIKKLEDEGFKFDISSVYRENIKDLGMIHAYK